MLYSIIFHSPINTTLHATNLRVQTLVVNPGLEPLCTMSSNSAENGSDTLRKPNQWEDVHLSFTRGLNYPVC